MVGLNLKICQNFVGAKKFSLNCWELNPYGGVKIILGKEGLGEEYLLLNFHYFISLEQSNIQKKRSLLRIFSVNVNASELATC